MMAATGDFQAEILKAIAQGTRLSILELLSAVGHEQNPAAAQHGADHVSL